MIPIIITGFKTNVPKGLKSSKWLAQDNKYLKGTVHKIQVLSLQHLAKIFESKEYDQFILAELLDNYPPESKLTFGKNGYLPGQLTSEAYKPKTRLHWIDVDNHKHLTGDIKISVGEETFTHSVSYPELVPGLEDEASVKRWWRRMIGQSVNALGTLFTNSFTTMLTENIKHLRVHGFVITDKEMTPADFATGFRTRTLKDRFYEGLGSSGPKASHPFIDGESKRAISKVLYEWTGEGSSLLYLKEGNPLNTRHWLKSSQLKIDERPPIKVYSPEDLARSLRLRAEAKVIRNAKAKANGSVNAWGIIESGGELPSNQAIYMNGVEIGQASDWLVPGNTKPRSVDSLFKPESRKQLYWMDKYNAFKDYGEGVGLTYTIATPSHEIVMKGKYIDLSELPKHSNWVELIEADAGTGKTRAIVERDRGLFGDSSGDILVEPNHAIIGDVDHSYEEAVRMKSGGSNPDKWDKLDEYGLTVMTRNKLYHEVVVRNNSVAGKNIIFDEIHTIFNSRSRVDKWIFDVCRGAVKLDCAKITLLTATINPKTLLIEDLFHRRFVTDEKTTVYSVRVLPWDEILAAKRAFIYIDNRAEAAILAESFKALGKKAIVVHGKNIQDEEGEWITSIDPEIEKNYDIIIATSALREGFSLITYYDIIAMGNIWQSQGSQGITQVVKRVRTHCDKIYLKIAYPHFREEKGLLPVVESYLMIAKFYGEVLEYDTLKLLQLENNLLYQHSVDRDTNIVLEDPHGAMVLYTQHVAAAEKRCYPLMVKGLLSYGIILEDYHSFDDDLSRSDIVYEEARLRGSFEEIYKSHKEAYIAYSQYLKTINTVADCEEELARTDGPDYIMQARKKALNRDYFEKEVNETTSVKEHYRVQARLNSAAEDKIKHELSNRLFGIYSRAADLIELDVKLAPRSLLPKIRSALLKKYKGAVTKDNLVKVLRTFCQFLMFDKSGSPMPKYKADKLGTIVITSFSLFDEDITYKEAKARFVPTLI